VLNYSLQVRDGLIESAGTGLDYSEYMGGYEMKLGKVFEFSIARV